MTSTGTENGVEVVKPEENGGDALSTAERARIERNRLKARALREARLVARSGPAPNTTAAPRDTGGGFLLDEEDDASPPRLAHPPAPLVDPSERPLCESCGLPVAHSFLLDTFGLAACDACRDDEGDHALVTRTEAKAEFLLKDCDLDLREPPLRCLKRRNPHAPRGDMRLYLRAQLRERALVVWGDEAALEEERSRRVEARGARGRTRAARRLRALRMDVRSTLFSGARATHTHEFGAETYDEADDLYTRACTTCPHVERYEKM